MDAASGVLVGSATRPRASGRRSTTRACRRRRGSARPAWTRRCSAARFRPRRARAARLAGSSPPTLRAAPGGGLDAGIATREEAAGAPRRASPTPTGPRVIFVGKLIVSKGVDLLLAAWPLVARREPRRAAADRRLRRVRRRRAGGSGRLGDAATSTTAREIARRGRGLEGGEEAPLRDARRLPRRPARRATCESAEAAPAASSFAGRLEHEEVGERRPRLPTRWSSRAPSPRRSAWSPPRPPRPARCRSRRPTPAAPRSAARWPRTCRPRRPGWSRSSSAMDAVTSHRRAAQRLAGPRAGALGERALAALRETAARLWSWEGVARGVLAASAGELDALPVPHVPPATSSDTAVGGRRTRQPIECRAVTRATYVRLVAAILVLTVVIAVPMTQIHWYGDRRRRPQAHEDRHAPERDDRALVLRLRDRHRDARLRVWKYRAKPGDESDGEPIHGNTRLEIIWTVIPTSSSCSAAIYSGIVLDDIESKASDALPDRRHRPAVRVELRLPGADRQGGQLERAVRPGRPPARPSPHRARRPALLLGARVADQARPGPRRARAATTSTTRRRHARQARRPTR